VGRSWALQLLRAAGCWPALFALSAAAATPELLPVSVAKDGIPAELGYRLRGGFTSTSAYDTGDRNLYYFLHWEQYIPHSVVRRDGPIAPLPVALNSALGSVRARTSLGELSLDQMLADPRSRTQGFLVVHKGRVVFEKYPGMRASDHHLWFSSSKSVAGLLVGLLEADGKLDVSKPIETYLPELANTHWRGIAIIDILDMASGLDLAESEQSRTDPRTAVNHFFRSDLGDASGMSEKTSNEILFGVGKKSAAGETFEYSSLNTKMLGLLVERVSGQRLADFLSERVWAKMGAEGDGLLALDMQGGPSIHGQISSRLRDKARYGMLYTPSWKAVAQQPVVPASLIDKIQHGCRPSIYQRGAAARATNLQFKPRCNSRQWDAVFEDGDFYKGGARGQGIYVSPSRDYVAVWFSTTMESGWMSYARAMGEVLERGALPAQAGKPAVREAELATLELGEHFDSLRGRRMRMNHAIINPGASGSLHSHRGRPEIVHVTQGVLTEHQGDVSREYRAGDTFVSNTDLRLPHRIENRSSEPTEVLLVEIPLPP